ncbi:hypothetical protein FA13DRAFT_1798235 [Coprinellus micaceus]|uniref:Uncharacterized protein n=1 Tax=Coprinellus micaceus TaxID=71717 RepID=A0A4Y7SN35_COPMI|nr:hypothetical protein FA13DRAFT_1798235 [Coprinellus micaceus]
MVKDRVTSHLSLKWELDKVESMLSGPNTFDGSCRSLRIVTYDHSDDHYGWMVLSKLIAKMKGLHAIQWIVDEDLNKQVLHAISQLPQLEKLEVVFQGVPSRRFDELLMSLPVSTLAKMKSICIQFRTLGVSGWNHWPISRARALISYLISNAPAIEQLEIGPNILHRNNNVDLGPPDEPSPALDVVPLFAYLQRRANFQPSLQSFAPLAIKFPISRTTIGFFAKLTTLHLGNHLREHEFVWSTLHTSGIRLTTVVVQWITAPLIQYLQGYHGLRAFHLDICSPLGRYVLDADVLLLLTQALPSHRQTLTDLRFRPSEDMKIDRLAGDHKPVTMLWDIPTVLGHLSSFNWVERLDLVQYMVEMAIDQQIQSLVSNISAITSHQLTSLNSVNIHIVAVNRPIGPRHTPADPFQNFRQCLQYVKELKLEQQPSQHWRRLHIILCIPEEMRTSRMPGIPFPLFRFAHRVVLKEQDVYGLEEYLEETELLNESGSVVQR